MNFTGFIRWNLKYDILLAFTGIFMLLVGFLFNRVVSNIGFLLIGIYTLLHIKSILWIFKDKWFFTFLLLSLTPLLSDIIYEGTGFLHERGIMKLLLILFPCFVFAFKPDKRSTSTVHFIIILVMLVSTIYSLSHYFLDYKSILASYKISKVMPTLSLGDHIRISWMTLISALVAWYEYQCSNSKRIKWILGFFIGVQVVFIHILGSKTGLITLYLTGFVMIFFYLKRLKTWKIIGIISAMLVVPYIASITIPSLKERINYLKYDFEHYSRGEYKEGLSDAVRFFSLKAGKDIITAHPVTGVGFSRLDIECRNWYTQNLPEMSVENQFIPSSQIVIYWASGGIFGLIIFLLHMVMPFFIVYLRQNVLFMTFFIPAICSFTFETHLEGQLPLFVYGFFVAWFWYMAFSNQKHKITGN